MQFSVIPALGPAFAIDAAITAIVIAGWAARDAAAVQHHIDELAALGVKPPRTTPLFYRVGANLLTTADQIDLAGSTSTGEAETVIIAHAGALYVGVGSDHTDRAAEAAGVTWSKQMCPKPVSSTLWRLADVADHWDQLILAARVCQADIWRTYQSAPLATLRTPADLISRYTGTLADGTAMFGGTPVSIPPIAWADAFEATLTDPVLNRQIVCRYAMTALAIAD